MCHEYVGECNARHASPPHRHTPSEMGHATSLHTFLRSRCSSAIMTEGNAHLGRAGNKGARHMFAHGPRFRAAHRGGTGIQDCSNAVVTSTQTCSEFGEPCVNAGLISGFSISQSGSATLPSRSRRCAGAWRVHPLVNAASLQAAFCCVHCGTYGNNPDQVPVRCKAFWLDTSEMDRLSKAPLPYLVSVRAVWVPTRLWPRMAGDYSLQDTHYQQLALSSPGYPSILFALAYVEFQTK
ncbi:hypothetical protein GY45DRAFT_1341561 [Cubamyces sp. BRFM 1775]|nr:hypothetical protein GY45DRAFT_1341561 [Cubamyces sp. BRFM 1775]